MNGNNGNNGRFTALLICTAMIAAAFLVLSSGLKSDSEIFERTLRFHVLANSDSEEDQKLKLAVKDAVILHVSEEMNQCKTKAEAENYILENKTEIEAVAKAVIEENGADHTVNLTLTREYYPRRTYGEVTLPAGEYDSVRILLGDAEGQNWWCVLFPQVCTDTATPAEERLSEAGFTSAQIRLLTEEEKPTYRIRFKLLELFSELISRRR